jgi:polar amino acid transport system substrate-binding protein
MKKSLIALVAALALPGMSGAQTIIGFDHANPPFSSGEYAEVSGIYPALIKEAFSRMKEPVTFIAYPWKRVISCLDAGELAAADIFINNERLAIYDYSKTVYEEKICIYVLKGKEFTYKTIADFAGKSIGIRTGWSYGDEFNKSGLMKDEGDTDEINLRKLEAGRIDAILSIPEGTDPLIKKLGLSSVVKLPDVYSRVTGHIAFAKSAKKTELLKRFDAAIESMRKDGSFDKIVAAAMSR